MFPFTEDDHKQLDEWLRDHDKNCRYADPRKQGAIGGRLTYMFIPTSIGLITKVKCVCGTEIDLTDYKSW